MQPQGTRSDVFFNVYSSLVALQHWLATLPHLLNVSYMHSMMISVFFTQYCSAHFLLHGEEKGFQYLSETFL
jgi:hypothetical protein